ncbi:transcriptional regulator form adherence 6 [Echria macrotheca]|uniref:Transcriptional regulator form adherence 6 n=1 Tax=Echria macrotheca TaxID=438768 RepID=A0AAJ0F810_9PEZI|nr:transcriptional regulator form adherence 6 [Echria macrotheca]
MPRTTLLPTPASSTDIKGQDGSKLAPLQMAFELPPPAVTPADPKSEPFPMQASETVKSRRRPSAAPGPAKDQFTLPPPPTRSRKIIQMKPREEPAPASTSKAATAKTGGATQAGTASAAAAGTKKKQPSATSAAGRKIARKTAHSLIERRRRSKMNEEFNVLKNLIPACSGEMHKLAILQASIEYVRYLEDCIAKLKEHAPQAAARLADPSLPSPGEPYKPDRTFAFAAEPAHSPDVEMTSPSSHEPSPTLTPNGNQRFQNQPSVSPALLAQDARHHRDSYSSAASTDYRHASFSTSATTSPAFGPQTHGYAQSVHSAAGSTLTSPALPPQRDLDQEATAALLMLNQTDRRGSVRGMSVRDLLST